MVYSVPARRDIDLTIQTSKERNSYRSHLHRSESKAREFISSDNSPLFLTIEVLPAAWEPIYGGDYIWQGSSNTPSVQSHSCLPQVSFDSNSLSENFKVSCPNKMPFECFLWSISSLLVSLWWLALKITFSVGLVFGIFMFSNRSWLPYNSILYIYTWSKSVLNTNAKYETEAGSSIPKQDGYCDVIWPPPPSHIYIVGYSHRY